MGSVGGGREMGSVVGGGEMGSVTCDVRTGR